MAGKVKEKEQAHVKIEDIFLMDFATGKSKKPSKYNNKKAELDGITFDSIKEMNYYAELQLLKRAGEVEQVERQVEFVLLPDFVHQGKKYKGISYVADFRVLYSDGRVEVVDVKGVRTKDYIIKKKLLLSKYPEINFREV